MALIAVVLALTILCAIEMRIQNRVSRCLIVCSVVLVMVFSAMYAGMEIGRAQAASHAQRLTINILDAVHRVAEREGVDQATATLVKMRTILADPNSPSDSMADIINEANNIGTSQN